jgi:amino acid transporter
MNFNQEFQHPPVNTSDWFLTVFIAKIPLIGFIMLIVWALDKNGNPSKANWAKAKLLWIAIAFGIGIIIFMFIGFGAISGIFDNFNADEFDIS